MHGACQTRKMSEIQGFSRSARHPLPDNCKATRHIAAKRQDLTFALGKRVPPRHPLPQ
jgi:hypothetical protein